MTEEEIRNKAYFIWEKNPKKSPLDCWIEAREELQAIENLTTKYFERVWGQKDV